MNIWMLIYLIPNSHWSTCSGSSSVTNTITSNQCSYTGYSNAQTYYLASGQVSNSWYYMYYVYNSPNTWVIRKINPDESDAWMAAFYLQPVKKGFAVDLNEQYVYVADTGNPMNVVRLTASTGAVVDEQHQ